MDAVDIVARGNLLADIGDIVCRAVGFRIHVALIADALHQ